MFYQPRHMVYPWMMTVVFFMVSFLILARLICFCFGGGGGVAHRYYCGICHLFDDAPGKDIYHCPYCNVCRLGKGLGVVSCCCSSCFCRVLLCVKVPFLTHILIFRHKPATPISALWFMVETRTCVSRYNEIATVHVFFLSLKCFSSLANF